MFIDFDELCSLDPKAEILASIPAVARENNFRLARLYKECKGLYAVGDVSLLSRVKVAVVGSRSPNQYAKQFTSHIVHALGKSGFVVVSGGAVGIDSIAHLGSFPNTIMVLPCGLGVDYPSRNASLIGKVKSHCLVLSEYGHNVGVTKSSFLERNRIIIALSDIVVIPYADLSSGSSSSADLCVLLGKEVFTLPHRIGESMATNHLLSLGRAKAIFDVSNFLDLLKDRFFASDKLPSAPHYDEEYKEVLDFIGNGSSYSEAVDRFGSKVLLLELHGKIKRSGLGVIIT